ncbi:histone-lysine N-methyltransferase, H3 lysine-79 specific isoform X1 [Zeugodacus cucurbitae]|uniref:histone-lysine N-methyltransferase, H3 lysine-79 specific isoform X1 n=1 Tax=Zeugodacus cucurbitae TaxID=28588 RepID=UPI0023D8E7A6|nr:histone-lysine N-methyltransferase, H3 lysine-79 specific isoform X1 [Zeugodacus cucurbitae]XP_028898033.2 histone-lysine N-methyltransferase, H3 lysine-79 specific isoform X1 [Zeugodacus cucurbitae]
MAAKPPKPPATFLKQSSPNNNNNDADNNDNNGNSNNSNPSTSTATATAVATPTTPTSAATHSANAETTYSKLGIQRYNSRENLLNNITNDYNYNNENDSETIGNSAEGAVAAAAAARPACNCTNISIMHLFHEMKQEFPTIPDPIVAQCVNDNCHQRENCIQMLRNELALNPIPVQTYPAKVLQQHHINNQQHSNLQQQKQLQQLKKSPQQPAHTPTPPQRHKNASAQKPATPLRPIRAAPTQPPSVATLQCVRAVIKNSAVTPQTNCDSVELVPNSGNLAKDVNSVQLPCNNQSNNNNNSNSSVSDSPKQACDMPVTATANAPIECARSTDFITALNRIAGAHTASPAPLPAVGVRARPNTLNLQASQQQLQRQQLNKQLQQHLQQRSQLKQHQQQIASSAADEPSQQKPIRRAPLPPIAPKPVFHNNISYNCNNNNNNNSCGNSPQSQSVGSCSTESAVTSPLSSCGESEVSANVGCTPSQAFALSHNNQNRQNNSNNNNNNNNVVPTYQPQPTSPLRSPIRHRSVITVQPEPPYARDFLPSTTKISTVANPTTGGSGGSTPTSQKSFTSVNLTLRQPTNAVPQSTIDISAGPVLSGNGSGLTYSSTSYNARHGFQQNFHITVTEEGGVFNASRIRPRNTGYYAGIEGANTPDGPAGGTGQLTPTTQQQQSQTPTTILRSPTTQAAQNIAPQAQLTTASSEDMCLPFENSVFIETIKRQKARRDKLASALRENKNKLGNVEEEVKMLTEPLNAGESERLDYEIERLRSDCQQTLNEIENIRRYGQLSEADRLKLQQQQQQQQQQQAFLRQRPPRPPPPQQQPQSPYQQYQPTEVDYLQQHNTPVSLGSTVGVVGSGPSSAACTPNSPRMQQPPPTQQRADYVGHPPQYQQLPSTDEEDYSDSNTDGGDDYEPLERWPCSMCTFLNHPQLNICEACECVRIIPGTIRIVSTADTSASAAAAAAMPQSPPAPMAATSSATAAAAAAALSAATPTAIAHGANTASAGNSPTSAARTVAAE